MKNKSIETHFEERLAEFDQVAKSYNWEDQYAYAAWLAQQYYLVRHSSRLLGLALSKIESANVRNEYIHHLGEERGHDDLLLNDLKSLGYRIEDFEEFPTTRLIIHNQYYWLNVSTADSLFGYAQYLEGIAVFCARPVIKRLEDCGSKGLNFLKVHAESDELHYPEGFARMHRNKVDWAQVILPNLEESHMLYLKMFDDLKASLANRSPSQSSQIPSQRQSQISSRVA